MTRPVLSEAVGGVHETKTCDEPDGIVANLSAGQLLMTGGVTSPRNDEGHIHVSMLEIIMFHDVGYLNQISFSENYT